MRWVKGSGQYTDTIAKLKNNMDGCDLDHSAACRNITLQVTEKCNCACTYCYQGNKSKKFMSVETGKKIVDFLFDTWYKNKTTGFINQNDTLAVILDFIGGEPLLNIDVMDAVCDYFWKRAIKENHPWAYTWCASISSNGTLYFEPKVQAFLQKYEHHVSYSITVDGPKEIHDACRLYANSTEGCFDEAYAALLDYKANYNRCPGTKITISPDNLKYLNTIAQFFFDNDIYEIHGNVIYEQHWTIEQGQEYYRQLKQLADTCLACDHDLNVSFFSQDTFIPQDPNSAEDDRNWCGGTGAMLAFDPDGVAYPCLRYMASSLGPDIKPLIIGDYNGIYESEESIKIKQELDAITRRSQSTDECFNCPIGKGCSWCSAWNYQENGTANKRSTGICNMHKARSLANVYFWNKYYLQEHVPEYFHRYLPDEDALKFIDKTELDMLDALEKKAYEVSGKTQEIISYEPNYKEEH